MSRCWAVWWGETTQQYHVPGARGHIAQHSTNKAGEVLWSLRTLLSCWTLFFQILVTMSCSRCICRSSLLSHRELGPYQMAVMIGNNCTTFVKCQHWKGVLIPTSHTTQSAAEPTPDNAHFWPPVILAVYTWCFMAWGKLSFIENKPWKKFWDPGADL